MLEERFSQLSLKGIPFRSLKSPTGPESTRLNELLEQISPGLSKIKSWDNKKISKDHPEVFALIEKHSSKNRRYYTNPIKCDPDDPEKCSFCGPLVAPRTPFDEIKKVRMPDPTPDPTRDGKFSHWEELKFQGMTTSERHRPSFAENVPVWASGKSMKKERARDIVICGACMKPRVIFSQRKLTKDEMRILNHAKDVTDYQCVSPLIGVNSTESKLNKLGELVYMNE